MEQKGLSIDLWCMAAFALVAAIMVLFGVNVREANRRIQEQTQIEESRRQCEQESLSLSEGSDYLTYEAYHFVVTGETAHLENYWREVLETRSRDHAIERLSALSLTDMEQRLVENAKHLSDELIKDEAWAMRLTADSIGMSPDQMPEQVAAARYENGEDSLSPGEKRELAARYIFGVDYTADKNNIMANLSSFNRLLKNRKNGELEESLLRTGNALRTIRYLMLALIAAFVMEAAVFYCFVIHPFQRYIRSLEHMDRNDFTGLPLLGSRETRAFARIFNRIYSEWQDQKERLEKERHRFHVAIENTSVIVYEYDAASDTYTAFGSLEKTSWPNAPHQQDRVLHDFMKERVLELMGEPGYEFFHGILGGAAPAPAELQYTLSPEGPHRIWVRLTAIPVLGDDSKIIRLIGKITDIQSEKEKEFALEDALSRDILTGFYKRKAGIDKVRVYLNSKPTDETCCMMLLDMDGFGRLNESEGQVFADAVLQDVADILRSQTRPDDILVRLGGDEFMLFLKECPRPRAVESGAKIAQRIRGLSGGNSDLEISASIGICLTSVVEEYSALYRCCESTLRYVKEHGKGQAALYLDTSNELGRLLTQVYPERHYINKIDRPEGPREDLTSFALDLLGKSKNLDDAIYLLLSRVGKSCGLDRILIIEMDMEYLACHTLYQWTRHPSDRESGNPIYLTKDKWKEICESYDKDGLSERRVITQPNHMPSLLHAAILDYGQCVGTMCFERRDIHQWLTRERQLLSELTRIISSFTLKAHADAVSKAKTDFLSRMSHEIRTPMNAITGMTIIAKAVPDNPGKTTECLDKIGSANKYLLSLINDVLDMSRIESGRMEIHTAAVSIRRLAENLESLIRPQADEKGIRFQIKDVFPEDRPVMADELRLNQVLVNLLGNAVKFTGEGGSITLEIFPGQVTDLETALRFSVTDTGIGIDKEDQARIFNAFEQAGTNTAGKYGGTGLGLAISSRLVQMMGGVLEVKSQPGEGSSFYFTVRLAFATEETAAEPESGDAQPVPFNPRGKLLLLVEDNELNREIAQEILEMQGFSVETASNGREGLTMYEQGDPWHYDAILMDIRMPVMDGMEATRRIRTSGRPDSRTIPIIAMTANAFDEDMKQSVRNGMDAHLSKPIDVDRLVKTLGRLISSRQESRG